MTHNATVTKEIFDQLKLQTRHLITKHDPIFMPGDTIMVSEPDSREQLKFEILSVDLVNIPGYKRPAAPSMDQPARRGMCLLGLYAPYATQVDDITGGPLDKNAVKNLSQQEG